MNDEQKRSKLAKLMSAFTPSAPIEAERFFAGREAQISKTVDTICETGKHAVLYGERGVGKTSLANIIPAFLNAVQQTISENSSEESKNINTFVTPVKITCNRDDSFGSCWKKVFKSITIKTSQENLGFNADENSDEKIIPLDQILLTQPQDEIVPNDIISALTQMQSSNFLFIFDEFDAVRSEKVRRNFSDTIKSLSDNIKSTTILLVGIGDSVSSLIGEHPSIERCITQIELQRMSQKELGDIIEKGLQALEMSMDENVKNSIVEFSQGFPHYTHLLAKYSVRVAINESSSSVTQRHFAVAVNEAIENVQESVRISYEKAITTSKKQDMFKAVVSACAMVEGNEYGAFRIVDLQEPLSKILNKETKLQAYQYHIGKLCQEEKGEILQKTGFPKNYRYRFKNPLLKAYVRLKLYQEEQMNG